MPSVTLVNIPRHLFLSGDGIFNSSSYPDSHKGIGGQLLLASETEAKILIDAHKAIEYRKFVQHSSLTDLICKLMGWKGHRLLDRTMLRYNVPCHLELTTIRLS